MELKKKRGSVVFQWDRSKYFHTNINTGQKIRALNLQFHHQQQTYFLNQLKWSE